MVALTAGAYASVGAIAAISRRVGVLWRIGLTAAVRAVVAGIGIVVAGPIFQVVTTNQWAVWLMAWLYVFGIMTIGVGLHPIFGKWTTPILTLLFVMLNVTSSGGVFATAFQPALFAGINTFWNGAAWPAAAQDLAYFPGANFGSDGLRFALRAAAGITLIGVTHLWSLQKRRLANDQRVLTAVEEEAVVAA